VKITIVGAGDVGFHIAERLSDENQDVVLIDKDPDKIAHINESLDVQALLGSGTSPRMLKESGVTGARILIAATDSDEVNLIACMIARNLNPVILKIARLRNQEYLKEEKLLGEEGLGIDQVINPELVMVETILNLLMFPGASEVIDFEDGRVKLIGVTIRKDSPFVGQQFRSISKGDGGLLVGAIVRGDQVLIPHGKDHIKADDLLYVVTTPDQLDNLFHKLYGSDREVKRVCIVGAGATGSSLAAALDRSKINVKLIEKDSTICTSLAHELDKVTIINGDGTDRDLLLEENISETDFLVAVTDDEESNVLMSLLGKTLGAKRAITRIDKLSYLPLVSSIGIDSVVSGRRSAVRAILQYIRRGKVLSVAPLGGKRAQVIEAEALRTADIVDTPLSQVKFPKGAILGAIIRNDRIIIPTGDSVVHQKDRLIIFALDKVITSLEKLLTVKLEYI
jgi:trk system potassium uptake protein TrkA